MYCEASRAIMSVLPPELPEHDHTSQAVSATRPRVQRPAAAASSAGAHSEAGRTARQHRGRR